jgi:hypothetical protein
MMSVTTRRPARQGRTSDGRVSVRQTPPSIAGTAASSALQAAAASLVAVMVPVVLAWLFAPGPQTDWSQAARVGGSLWLLIQHGGIAVPGGHVGLVPLGAAVIPFVSCWFAGRRLARVLDPRADLIASGRSRAVPRLPPLRAVFALISCYAFIAGIVSLIASMSGLRPISAQAIVGAGIVCGAGAPAGVVAHRWGGPVRGISTLVRRLLPGWLRRWIRPMVAALAVQAAAGALLIALMLVLEGDRVLDVHRALRPGAVGGAVLVLAQLALLPNFVIWAMAALVGPGFAVGSGTHVGLRSVELGPLPSLPVFGALPPQGEPPLWVFALSIVPVLAGVVAGAVLLRRSHRWRWWRVALDAAGSGLLTGTALGLLSWWSSGPAGPGPMAHLGPSWWPVGRSCAVEVAAGAVAYVLLQRGMPRLIRAYTRRGRR